MTVLVLQHVPWESAGNIAEWARERDLPVAVTRLYEGDPLPEAKSGDVVVAMGGPMGVGDTDRYPFLAPEIQWLREAADRGHSMVGVCLGAQLIAAALGAEVRRNGDVEIGWFPVHWSASGGGLPGPGESTTVFHWHGDTFDLPAGAERLASSPACANQGYLVDGRIVGLQFHIETTPDLVEGMIENCGDELVDAPWIQDAGELRAGVGHIPAMRAILDSMLDDLVR